MRLHRKAATWVKEVVQLFHGAVIMGIYREAPEHYLGYTVDGRVPVILIPGILGRWGYMKKLGDKISLLGHPVYIVPQLGLNIYSIPNSAKVLHSLIVQIMPKYNRALPRLEKGAQAVRDIIEQKDLKGAVLVAHSKGGLIGKYFLIHNNADNRVLGLVAIATPFSGSALAKLIPHDSFKELETDSDILRAMEKHSDVNSKIISIFPEYDTHVWAERGSRLDGAENIEVPVGGHNSIFRNKKVQQAVLSAIEKITRT